jgi:hypothetical protein
MKIRQKLRGKYMKRRNKGILIIGIMILALSFLSAAGSPHMQIPTHRATLASYSVPDSTSNNTSNVTHNASNPLYTEINMNLSADYSSLQLYVTAQPGIVSPMLTHFSVTLRAPGNSSYEITDSALNGGSSILKQGTFSYVTTFSLIGNNSGVANFTFYITSGTLHHTSRFSYLLIFMTPVNYINYEKAKLAPLGQLTYTQGAEIGAGGIVLSLGLYRLFLPVMKKKIQRDNKKGGLILLVKN